MIVRISGEDQYRLDGDEAARLNELDDRVVQSIERGDEDGFSRSFRALLDHVRSHGTPVGDDELESSDLILPPADLTLAEAESEFSGDGLIPD
jgi:hypothetical protein